MKAQRNRNDITSSLQGEDRMLNQIITSSHHVLRAVVEDEHDRYL